MCDTRTWVFKLLIVFNIIHFLRIQQCLGANASTGTDIGTSEVGVDIAGIPIDDDSFETTLSPKDTLSVSQRTNFNSTFNNRRTKSNNDDDTQSLSAPLSSGGSITNRLASDDGILDGDEGPNVNEEDDDDGSNEEFNRSERKFNNEAKQETEESKRSSILGILQGYNIGDSTSNPLALGSTSSSSWNGNANINEDDVDEILQPMELPKDDHHYHLNNRGYVMSSGRVGYPVGNYPSRNSNAGDGEQSNGSNSLKEESVTNRIKSGYVSAFEQHKALIRNNRRYGHKTHKKKYKDFLHYNPTTTLMPITTTITSLQKNFLARDRIFNSDDIPRQYYQGHVNYFTNTDENNNYHDFEKKDQSPSTVSRSYQAPSYTRQYQQHHLRSGGRYKHLGVQQKTNRPQYSIYPDHNVMNYHQLGSKAMQQHQKELEKKIDEYSQYYSKWPHLAQVEDQLFDAERSDILYPEGDGLTNARELVFAAEDDENVTPKEEEDANLPPYIKKYRRRNKQLLDLLEGTQPPPTQQTYQWSSSVLKPGPVDGSSQNVHRSHKKHHHHRQHRNRARSHRHKNSKLQIEDLFEEQRANPNNPNKTNVYSDSYPTTHPSITSRSSTITATTSTTTLSPFDELMKHENEHIKLLQENKLPAEDVSISRELYDWAIETDNDQPPEINNDDDTIDYNHSQLYKWKSNRNAGPMKLPATTTRRPITSVRRTNVYGSIIKAPPQATSTSKPINSFVYHRVVESPRAVGAGQTGRKQRLPFVAITDRRLETSKKGMGNAGMLAHKDFEQNHFPMP